MHAERKPSAIEEAMAFTVTAYDGLTDRERQIAETAAKAAIRWTKREIAETIRGICPEA